MKRIVTTLLLSIGLYAQTFEVTSVKPRPALGAQSILPACKDGRFVAAAFLPNIVRWAYDLQVAQLVELEPQFTPLTWYDLEATYNGQVSEDQCRKMAQNLLMERFKFASHLETRTSTVYNLVVARGGPKMPVVKEGDKSPGLSLTRNGQTARSPAGAPTPGLTMDEFATFLEHRLWAERIVSDRISVINKTGLQRLYKITLAYSQGTAAAAKTFADPDLPGAIQQQLGLKLEESKGPVSHFVIDHLEMPTEN